MECRGCSKDLTGLEYKLVAEWPFCLQCFEHLMEKRLAEEGEPVAGGAHTLAAGLKVEKTADLQGPSVEQSATCSLCGHAIDGEDAVRVGVWRLCRACHESLSRAPVPAAAGKEGPMPEDGSDSEESRIQVRVGADLQKILHCRGCGRRIRAGGSALVDGAPYCPDCFYSLSRPKGGDAATDLPDSETEATPAGERRCESCDRQTGDPMDVEGFTICRACYATDARIALSIARLRHLKRLRRIQAEIES